MAAPKYSKRLVFREMTVEDVPFLMKIFSDPVAMKYYPSTKTDEEAKGWIEWNLRNYKETGHGLWLLFDRNSGDFVGQCGLVPQKARFFPEIELGYLLAREHWGKGLATEAAMHCLDHAFEILKLEKIVSYIDPKNAPSEKLARRLGMTLEEFSCPSKNAWKKEINVFAITAESFRKLHLE